MLAVDPSATPARLPLKGWALDLARRWNAGTHSVFILHGNIHDTFPLRQADGIRFAPLRAFLASRLFPERDFLLFYDISSGLSFASPDMQRRFFEWLQVFDEVEKTAYHRSGPPRDFLSLAPLLQRFFQRAAGDGDGRASVTLVLDYPEHLFPDAAHGASPDDRRNVVTLLRWATSQDLRAADVGIVLVTEAAADLHPDLLENPHVAQVRLDLPDLDDRRLYTTSSNLAELTGSRPADDWSDLAPDLLASRGSGLTIVHLHNLVAESVRNAGRVTSAQLTAGKKRLIEEYCRGLVRFKDPRPDRTLDRVANHEAAKRKLRDLARLLREGRTDVVERGILVPGRVGVGKTFLIDCFASESGLPVIEIGEFRSKWVGDTERQLMRILLTIRALGPVIVVVDEADAVFGSREAQGDSGVSGRVFAAFAAHLGDSSLRGRELWVAMTSRPDLLPIDLKRQGRFGLVLPLFPSQSADEVWALFTAISKGRDIPLDATAEAYVRERLGADSLTGSEVESIIVRAREAAVLAGREDKVDIADLREAVDSFIDPLDRELLALQELAAVLACSDRRFLPPAWLETPREELQLRFDTLRSRRR